MKKLFVLSALVLLASSATAAAQSPLADAARREAERRKALETAKTPTTYTNEDLAKLPPRPAPVLPSPPAAQATTVGAAGAADAAAAPAPGAPTEAAAPRDEKYWRDRITKARTDLSRAEMFAESLQSRINALTMDVINRDDPAQRAKLADDRQKALAELSRVQTEIADFKKEIAAIEEEARRLGVPPGWLR
jgi:hypothetical protein